MKLRSVHDTFQLPAGLSVEKQRDFCLATINRYRQELPNLRRQTTKFSQQKNDLVNEIEYWREKYTKEKQEKEDLRKENNKLKKEIEKLTKTNNRHQIALFDHGNFTHPDHIDKKPKGGQIGHADTNREARVDYSLWSRKRLFAKKSGTCGRRLSRVKATRQKILLDIVISPEVVKLILESERQWCGNCQHEVSVQDNRSLPFTEYGINTVMMCMILRFRAHTSMRNISTILAISNGLTLAKSDVSNILKAVGRYLGKRYEELKKAVRAGEVMYADETGWLIHGQKAWMWIMANEHATVYFAAESRGKGIAEELYGNSERFAMTDGLKSYQNAIPKDKHLYCWAHVLRFSFEETIHSKTDSQAVVLREELVRIYHIKKTHPEYSIQNLEKVLRYEFDHLLTMESQEESFMNILRRVREQKEGLINALLVTVDGTNNLAERELRNMALKRGISHGSDTYKGMETTAVIGSVLQTLHRNKELPFLPTLQKYILVGIQENYSQYLHTPYHDV